MVDIAEKDLRTDIYTSGPDCTVRVIHVPSGIVVTSTNPASQIIGRREAIAEIKIRLAQQQSKS